MSETQVPLEDALKEAIRLQTASRAAGIDARLLGGVGVTIHAHGPVPPVLTRMPHDLDYIVRTRDGPAWREFLTEQGYEEDRNFNVVHGHQRLLHWDRHHQRQLDTFVGRFEMCHTLNVEQWWTGPIGVLPPADLLLTKLQVVEINDKDLVDMMSLLLFHAIGTDNPEAIDPRRISEVVGRDWGWYTTVIDNLEKLQRRAGTLSIGELEDRQLREKIGQLRQIVDAAPRNVRWRLRAAIGRRARWYDLPEEDE